MALAAVSTLAVSAIVAPAPAHAQRGVGAATAGGIIGGAISAARWPVPATTDPVMAITAGLRLLRRPAYVAGPYDEGACYWQRQRFWDGYGWRIRNVRVCG